MASVYNRGSKAKPNWWAKYKEDGRWKSVATGQATKEAAKAFASAAVARIKNGQVGIIERTVDEIARSGVTLEQLVERFNKEYRPPKVKNIDEYRLQTKSGMAARVLPTLGARKATSITSDEIETLRDRLLDKTEDRDGYARGSVAWTLARLSKVYNFGLRKKIIDGVNPVSGVDYPTADVSVDYLAAGEVIALLCYVGPRDAELAERGVPQLYAMISTALYAGLRKGELLGLRWIDVSLDRAQITVARSYTLAPKSGETRHVAINPRLLPILKAWEKACPASPERLVFPAFDVCDGWAMGRRRDMFHLPHYLKAAGAHVPAKPWHALRHTFASHFMMAGGNILTLQKLLGHASIEQTMIYAHLAPDFMAAEIARMSFPTEPAAVASLDEERRRRVALVTQVVQ